MSIRRLLEARPLQEKMKLWLYNPVTGYWVYKRGVDQNPEGWRKAWRDSFPDDAFRIAAHKPKGKPKPKDLK